MRFAAAYCIYDDIAWLNESIESIYYAVDAIYFLVSDRPWYGPVTDNKATLDRIRAFPDPDSKITIIDGSWTNETDQRNAGLDILRKAGFGFCFVIDADEIYDPSDLQKMKDLTASHPEIDCWHVSLDTYWKSYRYRIEPREPLKPPVFVRTEGLRFIQNRSAQGKNHAVFPVETGICHHLSYAHSDVEVLKKISTFSHAHEVQPGWFDNVWRRWDTEHSLTDLHPTHPHCYKRAVEQPYEALPPMLKKRYLSDASPEAIPIPGMTSIIILAHNRWDQTGPCIESIRRHTPENHEIIVIDNGSTDETPRNLRSLMERFPNLRVIFNTTNKGFAAGNNQGIVVSKGEYILLLNNDTLVTEGWLRNMLKVFRRNSGTGIVGPMSNFVSGSQLVRNVNYRTPAEMETFAAKWRKENEGQDFLIYRVVGFCLLTSKEVINRIGGLDEQFGSGNFEDDDFCVRAHLAGFSSRVAKDVFIHHEGSQTFRSSNIDYRQSLLRNWELFKEKWGMPSNIPFGQPYHIPVKPFSPPSLYVPLPYLPLSHRADPNNRIWEGQRQVEVQVQVEGRGHPSDFSLKVHPSDSPLEKGEKGGCLERFSMRVCAESRPDRNDSLTDMDVSLLKGVEEERQKDLVSIILLLSKQKEYAKRCVESIQQHTKEPYEIIIVPFSPSHNPPKWLRRLAKEDHRFRLAGLSGETGGFSARVNLGIGESRGEYIIVTDDALIATDNWLSGLLECLNTSSSTGIVGPMSVNIAGVQAVPEADILPDNAELYAKNFREKNRHRRILVKSLDSFCMLFRHEFVPKVGLFNSRLLTYEYADDDYCLKAALEGFDNLIAGDVFVYYRGHAVLEDRGGSAPSLSQKAIDKRIFSEEWDDLEGKTPRSRRIIGINALFLAEELLRKGEKENAVFALVEGIKNSPSERRLHYALAAELIGQQKSAEALSVLEKMTSQCSDPDEIRHDPRRLELMASCKENMGLYEEALTLADEALVWNVSSPAAWNIKGSLAFRKGLSGEAEKFFRRAIEADKGFGEAYSNLGALCWGAGKKDEAFDFFEKAFILSPTVEDIVTNYYSAAVRTARLERAADIFRNAIALHPRDRKLKFIHIDNLLQQKKFPDAMTRMEEAIAVFGTDDNTLTAALNLRKMVGPLGKGSRGQGAKGSSEQQLQRQEPRAVSSTSSFSSSLEPSDPRILEPAVSLCMIVKNEEKNIVRCLMSVKSLVDEIIIVDTGSTDRTKKLAEIFGAKVYDFPWRGDFAEARNFSLSKASGDWILILDADEVISELDHARLKELIQEGSRGRGVKGPSEQQKKWSRGRGAKGSSERQQQEGSRAFSSSLEPWNPGTLEPSSSVAFSITTRNYVGPVSVNWHPNDGQYKEEAGSGWFPSAKVRLFPNDTRVKFERPVHEMVEESLKRAGVKILVSDIPVHHYGKLDRKDITAKGEEYYQLGKKKLENEGSQNPAALYELAVQAAELEKYDEAIEYWRKLIVLSPGIEKARHGLGTCLFQTGKYREAMVEFREALRLNPEWKDSAVMYATCQLLVGKADDAVSFLENLLHDQPDYPLALLAATAAYLCAEHGAKAMECVEKIRNTQFALAPYLNDIAKLCLSVKQTGYARTLLEAAVETENTTAETLSLLERCKDVSLRGGHDEAIPPLPLCHSLSTMPTTGLLRSARNDKSGKHPATSPLEPSNPRTLEPAVSLCMIVKNEEENIAGALDAVRDAIDEIVVVDTGSTDRTKEIAASRGAKVYDFPWTDSFSEARNFASSKATGQWILVLDADERISKSDHGKLRELIKDEGPRGLGVQGPSEKDKGSRGLGAKGSSEQQLQREEPSAVSSLEPLNPRTLEPSSLAYSFTTRNYVTAANIAGWNANRGEYPEEAGAGWVPGEKVRLFPNNKTVRFEFPVHERVEPSLLKAKIEIRKTDIPIHHYGKLNGRRNEEKAQAYYLLGKKKLAESGKADFAALYEFATQCMELGKYEEAIEYLHRIIAMAPPFPEVLRKAYSSSGNASFNLGRYEEAFLSYSKALEFDPPSRDARLFAALCKIYTGKGEDAARLIEGLQSDPTYPQANLLYAIACFCSGRKDEGIESIRRFRAGSAAPDGSGYFLSCAKKLMELGRREYAKLILQGALDAGIENREIKSLLEGIQSD